MQINSVSTTNFNGKYQLNANQIMKTDVEYLKRDALMGFWSARSKNGEKIHQKLIDFYKGDFEQNVEKPLNITFDIPSKYNKHFEESMDSIGQAYTKLA